MRCVYASLECIAPHPPRQSLFFASRLRRGCTYSPLCSPRWAGSTGTPARLSGVLRQQETRSAQEVQKAHCFHAGERSPFRRSLASRPSILAPSNTSCLKISSGFSHDFLWIFLVRRPCAHVCRRRGLSACIPVSHLHVDDVERLVRRGDVPTGKGAAISPLLCAAWSLLARHGTDAVPAPD
jgi:hypothetical protein